MTREERDKICLTCVNHKNDERYGVLCGLTDNLANFQDSCKDYAKVAVKPSVNKYYKTETKITKRKKKDFGSIFSTGILLYIIFKIVMFLIKQFNN